MDPLTYGDLVICELALVQLSRGVNPDSELGRQVLECIGKIDAMISAIRADLEKKSLPS